MNIITGMHRSGTSLTSNLVMAIFGQRKLASAFVEADQWNRNGYYEDKEFVILNNSILVGKYAPSSILLNVPPEKRNNFTRALMSISHLNYLFLVLFPGLIHKRAARRSAEMANLANRFKGKYIKDPRFSLLINDWHQFGQIEKVLFCFRNPREVAKSLKRRNYLPLFLGYTLWAFHNRQFLKNIQDLDVVYVNYNNYFDPEKSLDEIKRLYFFLGKEYDREEALAYKRQIIKPELKNHSFDKTKIPEWLKGLYACLLSKHASFD